jgi:uncharacterized protein (DUF1015 family)
MSNIRPFKALRPHAQLAKQVASKPYDVLNSAEAKVEAQGNPASFLHITKSEIDLPEGTDIHSVEVYEQAKQNLEAFIKRDVLFQDDRECYYIYRLVMNGRSQTGLVCVSSVDDYENNIIKKHEFTRPDKEQDRIDHMRTIGAQTGNVFLAYRNVALVDELIENWMKKGPVYDFVAEDGIAHTIWIVSDSDVVKKITALFAAEVPCTYIADGHHRAASAAKVRKALGAGKTAAADYFLTTLFPASQLYIMDYNRLVKNLNGYSADAFLQKLEEDFTIAGAAEAVKPASLHEIGLYINKKWYRLTAKPGTFNENDPIGVLDVSILQDNILSKLLNIQDPRTDKNIDFVGGIRGLGELEKRVNSGEMAAAFSLYPVSIEQLFAIADSGNVMPPKSTWFEPKLRDGLLTHLTNK